MSREISKEEWAEWLQHPVTQLFHEAVRHKREGVKESWATGLYTSEADASGKFLNAGAIAEAMTLQGILDLDVATVNEELKDE